MTAAPLVPAPLYGLRTWSVSGEPGAERLTGPHQGTSWPAGDEFYEATCSREADHDAPAHDCSCGIHAWHPSRANARRVLAVRRQIPGVIEARGAIEVHEDGFRAERARPYALVLRRGANAELVRRLARAQRAEVAAVDGAGELLTWCRDRGLGLDDATVGRLLGLSDADLRARRRARARATPLRIAAIAAVSAVLVVLGLQLLTDPTGPRVINGRTGEVRVEGR